MTRAPLEIMSYDVQNASGGAEGVQLAVGPFHLEWVSWACRVTVAAAAAQTYWGQFQLSRRSTYYVFGGAGQALNSDVYVLHAVGAFGTAAMGSLDGLHDNGYDRLGIWIPKLSPIWLHSSVSANSTFLTHVTIGFRRP
jgi:hypothetical protein